MARRKKASSGGGGGGDWLNTYADMVTLLLTFFILLFSMSSLDASKYDMLVAAFASKGSDSSAKIVLNGLMEGQNQDGLAPQGTEEQGEVPNENQKMTKEDAMNQIYEAIQKAVKEQGLEDSISVSKGEDYVFIRFMNNMLFEANRSVLKQSDKDILKFVGDSIKSVENYAEMISIHGHTAQVLHDPNYPVNDWELSAARALAVLMFFEEQSNVEPSKLLSIGWGKNQPIADNDTEEGRSQNRRVEILISGDNLLSEQLDNIYEKLVQ